MTVHIKPSSSISGKILLPTSKSYSIRAFMIAACGGKSVVVNPSNCDDSVVALKTARALGVKVKACGNNTWKVDASKRKLSAGEINVSKETCVK